MFWIVTKNVSIQVKFNFDKLGDFMIHAKFEIISKLVLKISMNLPMPVPVFTIPMIKMQDFQLSLDITCHH